MAKFKDGDTVEALIDIEIDLIERDSFIIKKGDQFPLNKFLAETWVNGRFAVKEDCGLVNESDFKLVVDTSFKVGDKVRILSNVHGNVGSSGIINSGSDDIGYLRVRYDIDNKDISCGWLRPEDLELIESEGYTNQEMIDRIEMAKSINGIVEEKVTASETQVAGNHYSKLKIQPMEYCLQNDLNYGQSNAIKYITRYKDKNGIEDLKKAIHCIELLIEFEEKE